MLVKNDYEWIPLAETNIHSQFSIICLQTLVVYLAKKTGRNIESFALSILCNKWKVLSSFNELSKPIIIIIWDLFYMRACEGIHKQKRRNVEKKMKIVFIAKNCKSVKRLRSFHSFFLAFFGLHWLIKSREWNKLHIPLFYFSRIFSKLSKIKIVTNTTQEAITLSSKREKENEENCLWKRLSG